MAKSKIIKLPKIMLAADIKNICQLMDRVLMSGDEHIRIDADILQYADPLSMCLLASVLHKLQLREESVLVENLRPEVAERLRRLDVFEGFLAEKARARNIPLSVTTLQARAVTSPKHADEVANLLADTVANYAPPRFDQESKVATREPIREPLAYIFSELLENALSHARAKGFLHSNAFVAAQYFSEGDLVKLAVVDNGCGFLSTLENHSLLQNKSHESAIRTAFQPFVSCNKEVGLLDNALNAGLGLTVSRDIAIRSGGMTAAGSGNAWVIDPGREGETLFRIPTWQGSMVSVELRTAGLLAFNFFDIFNKYHESQKKLPSTLFR